MLAVLAHIEIEEIRDTSITVRMLLRDDEPLVKSESEDGLINPTYRRSISQIIGNAHLRVNVHSDESIGSRNMFVMHKSAS